MRECERVCDVWGHYRFCVYSRVHSCGTDKGEMPAVVSNQTSKVSRAHSFYKKGEMFSILPVPRRILPVIALFN